MKKRPAAAVVGIHVLEHLRADRPRFGTAYRAFLTGHSLQKIGPEPDALALAREKSAGRRIRL